MAVALATDESYTTVTNEMLCCPAAVSVYAEPDADVPTTSAVAENGGARTAADAGLSYARRVPTGEKPPAPVKPAGIASQL